jgi:hypothetical protein
MGPFFSKSVKHVYDFSRNNNRVWVIDGVKLNISSIVNQTMKYLTNRWRNMIVVNNFIMVIIFVLIVISIALPLLFFSMKHRKQQSSFRINTNKTLSDICAKGPLTNVKCSSEIIPGCNRGYIPSRF